MYAVAVAPEDDTLLSDEESFELLRDRLALFESALTEDGEP